jgi:hypothetical protein
MLGEKLIEAVCIAGLKENENFAFELCGFGNKIFREVRSAEIVENEAFV